VFVYHASGQHDPKHSPPLPDGMPPQMLAYDRFADMYGWTPRQVDELTLEEFFWLPVVRDAKAEAAETLRPRDLAATKQVSRC
jgi:hypothetical protein